MLKVVTRREEEEARVRVKVLDCGSRTVVVVVSMGFEPCSSPWDARNL